MQRYLKGTFILIFIFVAMFGLGLYTNVIKLPLINEFDVQYVANFDDDRVLLGASHNVFVAKVLKKIGQRDYGYGPASLFEVQIIKNIKGNLSGNVMVLQQAGYKNGILNITKGDSLLEPSKTYLLATRYNNENNWYTVTSHPNGKKLISEDYSLGISKLEELANKDLKVIKFIEAYKNEIPLVIDIKNNNARNSYKSLYSN